MRSAVAAWPSSTVVLMGVRPKVLSTTNPPGLPALPYGLRFVAAMIAPRMVDYSNIPRDSRRVPLETRVQFKFDRFSGFLSDFSSNVSPGGMFIRTRTPQPAGTVLEFEFRLGD